LDPTGRLVEDLAEGAVDEVVRDAGGAAGADGHVADAAEVVGQRPIQLVGYILLSVVMHRLVGQDLVDRRAVKIPMLQVRRLIAREGQGDMLPVINVPRLLVRLRVGVVIRILLNGEQRPALPRGLLFLPQTKIDDFP